MQVDKIDPTKRFALLSNRLQIVERDCNEVIEINVLDIEDLLDVCAAVSERIWLTSSSAFFRDLRAAEIAKIAWSSVLEGVLVASW